MEECYQHNHQSIREIAFLVLSRTILLKIVDYHLFVTIMIKIIVSKITLRIQPKWDFVNADYNNSDEKYEDNVTGE